MGSTEAVVSIEEVEVRRRFFPQGSERAYRLARAVRLIDVASVTGFSLTRLSLMERDPATARAGELETVRRAVDEIVRAREAGRR